MSAHNLFLASPAVCWSNAFPVGNGSMGAMLFGGTEAEKIYLSEESIWNGNKIKPDGTRFREKVAEMRKMYLNGERVFDEWAKKNISDGIFCVKSNEYAGVVTLTFADKTPASDYRRELDLVNGVFTASYKKGSCEIKEQAFSSYSSEITAVRISSSEKIAFAVEFDRENIRSLTHEDGVLTAKCVTQDGVHAFAVGISVQGDCRVSYYDGKILVSDSVSAFIAISIATEFNFGNEYADVCGDILDECDSWDDIFAQHVEDFSSLAGASDIVFENDQSLETLPVDERLRRLKDDESARDDGLKALYFAFGKYLLISSSRENTLPANLQGVWVEKLENPWNADYHTNINLQMNYWLPETANLSECHLPLFDYMNGYLLESGKKTAESYYGCRGTVLHHLSDIYGFTSPADGLWGVWPMGGAWLSVHMWEHWLFTLDKDFLSDTAYGYMRECVLFLIDYLFEASDGTLRSGPSMSPELSFYADTPEHNIKAYICFSPAMDTEIITACLRNYIACEDILKRDKRLKAKAQETLAKLPPLKVGKHGQLMEWLEDYDETDPGHRHISHAFALYPDNSINKETPELFDAIKKTIDRRLANGGGHTGWSRAWLINLFARLCDGENAEKHLRLLLTRSTLDNMLDNHPPFQIDGNFGGAAGIAEMLLQSHMGYISLLPAVDGKTSGSFSKLKARGNIEVSADFTGGNVTRFELFSVKKTTVRLAADGIASVIDASGEKIFPEDGFFSLLLTGGKAQTYSVNR